MGSPIRAMTGDVADTIRPWVCQYRVEMISPRGEGSRYSICTSVQSEERVANLTENIDGSAAWPTPPSFSNNFVPQVAKFVLQFRPGTAYVKLGKRRQSEGRPGAGAKGLAGDVDQEGK
jgi:hypothetical protein